MIAFGVDKDSNRLYKIKNDCEKRSVFICGQIVSFKKLSTKSAKIKKRLREKTTFNTP